MVDFRAKDRWVRTVRGESSLRQDLSLARTASPDAAGRSRGDYLPSRSASGSAQDLRALAEARDTVSRGCYLAVKKNRYGL